MRQRAGLEVPPKHALPSGPYLLFNYADEGGGGIRKTDRGEEPKTTPTVNVPDVRATVAKAVRAGATVVSGPETMMEGVVVAHVRIPGGVLLGLAGER